MVTDNLQDAAESEKALHNATETTENLKTLFEGLAKIARATVQIAKFMTETMQENYETVIKSHKRVSHLYTHAKKARVRKKNKQRIGKEMLRCYRRREQTLK